MQRFIFTDAPSIIQSSPLPFTLREELDVQVEAALGLKQRRLNCITVVASLLSAALFNHLNPRSLHVPPAFSARPTMMCSSIPLSADAALRRMVRSIVLLASLIGLRDDTGICIQEVDYLSIIASSSVFHKVKELLS